MEALLIVLALGLAILLPVGSVLGILAFSRRRDQSERLESLNREVSRLREEVTYLKQHLGGKDQGQPAPELELELDEAVVEDTPAPSESSPSSDTSPFPDTSSPGADATSRDKSRFVQALKDNWMVWLGGLSVGLAGIFMVSHSINAGMIGPSQQLMLALFSGLALHAGAEYLRRRNRGANEVFAALAGGGSITLYAALLAGVHHYGLVGPTVGLFGLAIVSLGTMVLSLFHGPLLAVMGLSGAYLVPLLIGGDDGSVAFVLSYSFLITVSSLMLMRYVYRDWLWYATLSGALLWWLATSSGAAVGASTAWYIAALFVVFAMVPVRAK